MSDSDPARDGWHLPDAVMQTERQDLLAVIHATMKELRARGVPFQWPDWWCDGPGLPSASYDGQDRSDQELIDGLRCLLAGVETRFLHELYEGKLVCWGRPGSSLAKYARAPAWAVTGIESWWKGGGIIRLESGELLYTARIERPREVKTNSGGSPGHWYRDKVIAHTVKWLDQEGEPLDQEGKTSLPEIRKFMSALAVEIDADGGPSRNTLASWAEKALIGFRQMRGIR